MWLFSCGLYARYRELYGIARMMFQRTSRTLGRLHAAQSLTLQNACPARWRNPVDPQQAYRLGTPGGTRSLAHIMGHAMKNLDTYDLHAFGVADNYGTECLQSSECSQDSNLDDVTAVLVDQT